MPQEIISALIGALVGGLVTDVFKSRVLSERITAMTGEIALLKRDVHDVKATLAHITKVTVKEEDV